MITIPISFISVIVAAAVVGALGGLIFTFIFNFGCDNKVIKRNCIVGSVIGLSIFTLSILTKFGYIIWK